MVAVNTYQMVPLLSDTNPTRTTQTPPSYQPVLSPLQCYHLFVCPSVWSLEAKPLSLSESCLFANWYSWLHCAYQPTWPLTITLINHAYATFKPFGLFPYFQIHCKYLTNISENCLKLLSSRRSTSHLLSTCITQTQADRWPETDSVYNQGSVISDGSWYLCLSGQYVDKYFDWTSYHTGCLRVSTWLHLWLQPMHLQQTQNFSIYNLSSKM